MKEQIVISGGTGLLGNFLKHHLREAGYDVIILCRSEEKKDHQYHWNPAKKKFPMEILKTADYVINLTGANLDKRWTESYKKEILDSRTIPTRYWAEILENNEHKIKKFINAAGISIYGDNGDKEVDESASVGEGFLPTTCYQWEKEAMQMNRIGIPLHILRISPVLHQKNPFLRNQWKLARFRLLAPLGNGKQYIPWIHWEDFCGIVQFLLENTVPHIAVNLCAPTSIDNESMTKIFEEVVDKTQIMPPVPLQVLRWTMGEKSTLISESVRAIPKVLNESGYQFKHPDFKGALETFSTWELNEE